MHGLGDDEHTLVSGFTQCSVDIGNLQFLVLDKTVHSLTNHSQSLLDSLLEVATDSHHLAHRLHRRTEFLVNATELGEVPTWNLTNDIVEGWFEECRGGLGDRVLQLEQAIAHTQLGSHEGERITRCLRCQCRRTAQAGVNLNDAIILALRVEGILHVALSHYTDVTHNLDRQCAQLVILAVGECLRRSDDDTLTRVNTERVEILHVTYGDTVVVLVAHNLIFNLLPSLETLLDEHLGRE